MIYSRDIRIEFNHCDPAGIVFFPRYFEMINSMAENFFRDRLDYPFERIVMEDRMGVPTAHLNIDFRAPSRLGEVIRFSSWVERIGRSSVDLRHRAVGDGVTRVEAQQRMVWIGGTGRAEPWPDRLRERLENELSKGGAA